MIYYWNPEPCGNQIQKLILAYATDKMSLLACSLGIAYSETHKLILSYALIDICTCTNYMYAVWNPGLFGDHTLYDFRLRYPTCSH